MPSRQGQGHDDRDGDSSPRTIWVPGYWNWDGSQYQWVAGHVENPPSPQVRWRAPRYQRRGGGWVVTPGAWQ